MQEDNSPYNTFKLFLSDVLRYFAIHLARTQSHRQRRSHIGLDGRGNVGVLIRGTDPYFR